MAKSPSKLHAVVVPVPYQGHINPFINLAIKLASKGITVTFIHTQHVHDTLTKTHHNNNTRNEVDFFSEARKSGLDIRYSTISDGFPMDFDRGLHFDVFWESLLRDFPARVDEFLGNMILSDPSSICFLVVDTFFSWSTSIAKKYSLVNVSFWTQTALAFSVGYHLDLLYENGHCPIKDNVDEKITYLPGIEAISLKDLMPYLKESETTKANVVSIKAFEEAKKADFILLNTVEELEFHALAALNQKQPTYAVGPVNFIEDCRARTITKSLWAESDCEKWLESKRPGSVLYVSFGSLAQISKQEIEEIAYGLLLSEVNFIWVVRADIVSSDEAHALPDGFEDDIKDKGLIVPWCDQINVLSNPAVGVFLTHCGWNSTLESIWCGVPMICHPFIYDQPTNRKLIVEDLKVGINLLDGVTIHREQVAVKIKNSMSERGLRQEVEKAKIILHNAIEIKGSSDIKFDQFIQDLETKICS